MKAPPKAPMQAPTLQPPGLAALVPGGQKLKERAGKRATEPRAPKTPAGMPQCHDPMEPAAELPRGAGETVRYVVDVNGLSLGTIDFKIERRGTFSGQPVTEYRSLFKLDSLVSTFMPVEGRAAALVPDSSFAPVTAMSHYTLDKNQFEENQTFSKNGAAVASKRVKNGKPSEDERLFPGPATDFVSAFYFVRSLPPQASGCVIIYGNHRAYTVWIKGDGKERIKTPVGFREADRYAILYASDRAKQTAEGHVWIATDGSRLPYKADLVGRERLEARVHLYENGAK